MSLLWAWASPSSAGDGSISRHRLAGQPRVFPTGSGSLSGSEGRPVPEEPTMPEVPIGPSTGAQPPVVHPAAPVETQVPVGDPAEHPRLPWLENPDPHSFWYTMRPNLLGQQIPDEWDFGNIISTDRPDFTDAPFSVGRGITVIETGYTYRHAHADDVRLNRRTLPELLVRYGITDEFELRFRWNGYILLDQTDLASGGKMSRFGGDDVSAGFKWEMRQQDGLIPMLTLVSGTSIPTGTNGMSANQTQPFVNVVYGWGLKRWLYLKGSTGVDFSKSSSFTISDNTPITPVFLIQRDNLNLYHQSLSLLVQYSKHYGGYYEWFSFYSTGADDNAAAHYLNTGLYIYATPNLQFDARIGARVSHRVQELFTGVGLSVRY